MMFADDLHSNGQTTLRKGARDGNGRVAGDGDKVGRLHPGPIVFHLSTGNLRWKVDLRIERQHLTDRQDEEVVFPFKPAEPLEQRGSPGFNPGQVRTCEFAGFLDVPMDILIQLSPMGGQQISVSKFSRPMAPGQKTFIGIREVRFGPLDWFEETVAKFRTRMTSALALVGLGFWAPPFSGAVRITAAASHRARAGKHPVGRSRAPRRPAAGRDRAAADRTQRADRSNQDIIERARTQVGNLAHALKTPLAVITNEARDDRTALGAKVAEQAQLMRDQIGHYLDRARMAARVGAIGRVTSVDLTVEPLVGRHRTHPRRKGRCDSLHVQPGAKFQGEKHDLEEMLGNLLDNACKWGKSRVYLAALVDARETTSKRGSCASPSRMTAPAFHPSNARKLASAACDWTKPSRVPGGAVDRQ